MTPLILAALLAAADPGAGQPAASKPPVVVDAPPQPAKAAKDPNKLVCRSEDQVGSNIKVRTCKTQSAWDAQEEQVRQYFQDASDHGGINGGSSNPMAPH